MCIISFFGDVCLLRPKETKVSDDVRRLLTASEFNVINLEAPVKVDGAAGIEKSGPFHCQNEHVPEWLEKQGWNAISLANNHMLDFGEESLKYTRTLFKKAKTVGAGNYSESYQMLELYSEDGLRIGILAGAHNEFGVLKEKSDDNRQGTAWVCSPDFIEAIVYNRSKVDYLVAYIHAGVELFNQPLPEWRRYYQMLIDLGCDAVIASHPHVPQGWEIYMGKIISYSLGNFCFQKKIPSKHPLWNKSLCCSLTFEKGLVPSFRMIPLCFNEVEGKIEIDTSEEYDEHLKQLNNVLRDDNKYNEYINTELPKLWKDYKWLFEISGMFETPFSKEILNVLKKKIRGVKVSKTHLLNNFQNESHRWAIERIIRINEKIVY